MLKQVINETARSIIIEAVSSAEPENGNSSTEKPALNDQKVIELIRKTKLDTLSVLSVYITGESKEDENLLKTAANLTRLIGRKNVDIALLQEELETSLLTGLPNQRIGTQTIKKLIEENHPFCWTFFDLDHLKPMNLVLGEHVADRLIRGVGDTLKRNIRTNEADGYNDMVIHRSGDEFWLILNHTNLNGGMIASQHVLERLTANPITIKMTEEDVNYSFSVYKNLKTRLETGEKLKDFEQEAIPFIEQIRIQIEKQEKEKLTSRRINDHNRKIYFVSIPVTASMGCTEFSNENNSEKSRLDIETVFDSMSSRIKSAEEKAKMDGRNCVRGFDGQNHFKLLDNNTLQKISDSQ